MASRKERQKQKKRAALAQERNYEDLQREMKSLKKSKEDISTELHTCKKELHTSKLVITKLRAVQRYICVYVI